MKPLALWKIWLAIFGLFALMGYVQHSDEQDLQRSTVASSS